MRPRPAFLTVFGSLAAAALAATSAVAAVPSDGPNAAPPVSQAVLATDTDGDSLPDTWETNGYDANGDGVVDVDLKAMGADPKKKDLFVELDYMAGRLASVAALDRIVQVFAQAPVMNPNGTAGINIHLDAGPAGGTKYNLGGGNEVPYDADLNPAATETTAIKNTHFKPVRKAVFHYALFGDSYGGGCSSGNAFAIPNDTFIVTVGPKCNWNATDNTNVGTFIHELGHNLGLRHGGSDHVNYKPNYLSVMNYFFQLGGVPKADGTRYWSYSNVAPGALNETALKESIGLGPNLEVYKTSWKCPDGTSRTTTGTASGRIDWNCDGDTTDTGAADINDDNLTNTLTTQNNWANITFGGGAVGQGANIQSKTAPAELQEMTRQEWTELQHDHK
ncbi:zinc-dependent metalloprotease family protein [Kribbella sp. NPDC056951]|uniref:zinc-dependent metalloprotease family protein n=1 Tax=Kribbella sp. NPDC056951 TaxID=3345978 RepID=UPI003635E089